MRKWRIASERNQDMKFNTVPIICLCSNTSWIQKERDAELYTKNITCLTRCSMAYCQCFLARSTTSVILKAKYPEKHFKENPLSGGLASLNQAWNKRGSALDFDCPRVEYCSFVHIHIILKCVSFFSADFELFRP